MSCSFEGECLSSSLSFTSSIGHEDMNWEASSKCALWILSGLPIFHEVNLEVSDSRLWQPSKRQALKLAQVVMWIWLAQCVTLWKVEGVEKFGWHIIRYSRSPLTFGRVRYVYQGFLFLLQQVLIGGAYVFWYLFGDLIGNFKSVVDVGFQKGTRALVWSVVCLPGLL